MKSYIYAVIGILLVLKDANCTIDLTATPYLQRFVSHDAYDGTVHYPEGNYSRDWLITGEIANYTITIEFEACVIEAAKGICLFDDVFIYDGSNSSAPLLLQTCCGTANPPPFTLQSTDGTMYVLFTTDDTFAAEGFRVSYILQGAPTSTVSITTVQIAASTPEDNILLYIIIACAITALLIIIIIILICIVCCKKKSKVKKTKKNVTSIDDTLEERPLTKKVQYNDYYTKSDDKTSRSDKAAKMVFNITFFESLNKTPPKYTWQSQERKVIHSKNSVVPIESNENEKSNQVRDDGKNDTKKNQSDKNNHNDNKCVINLTPENMMETTGNNEIENKPILLKSAPSILNSGTTSEQPKGQTNGTSNRSVDNSPKFTIPSGATSNFKKSKERKRFRLNIKQYIPENKISLPKLNEEHYEERMENLKNIYQSHSKHGHNDRNIARARTHVDFEMQQRPTAVRENPPLVQPKNNSIEIIGNQQVTKATVLRGLRTMGVDELRDESIPDLIPRTQAFSIIQIRTTVCDDDLVKSSPHVLPPLRGIQRQELPDLQNLRTS